MREETHAAWEPHQVARQSRARAEQLEKGETTP